MSTTDTRRATRTMRPVRSRVAAGRQPRVAALDGVRGLAVAAVVAYHLGAGWLGGGYLGVDLFFVLSGYLITSLLLDEERRHGTVDLLAFWVRRARRLLPALMLLLMAVAAAAAGGLLWELNDAALRGDVLSTLAYVANWHELWAGYSYFARFAAPSPLAHTWSLAIEEQFYVLWPPLLAGLLWTVRRKAHPRQDRPRQDGPRQDGLSGGNRAALFVAAAGALASAAWMAWLALHGAPADRMYYGTDTRAFDLLAGAALAAAVAGRRQPGPAARRALHAGGLAGAAIVGWGWVAAGAPGNPPHWVFEGGMALFALAALAVLADARLDEAGPLGRVLQTRPIRFLGRVSYALYLWHWPVIVELTPARTGVSGAALECLRLAAMAVAATASTLLVEEPLRRRRHVPTPGEARLGGPGPAPRWRAAPVAPLAGAGVAAALVLVMVGTALPAAASATAAGPPPPAGRAVAGAGGLEGQAALELASSLRPSATAPLRVTLIGDSVMRAQAPAVTAALAATGAVDVTDFAYDGWGLSNDPRWPAGVPAMLRRTRPQLVVGTWSWDGSWAASDPSGYRSALRRFISTVLDPHGVVPGADAVVLEQFPPLGPLPQATGGPAGQARRLAGVRAWNAVAASMPALFPGRVLYLPMGGAVESGGRYTTWMRDGPHGPLVRLRSVDHTHFCPAGAARYADALLSDLEQELSLPPASPAWWSGAWATNARYRTPPGSCPGTTGD